MPNTLILGNFWFIKVNGVKKKRDTSITNSMKEEKIYFGWRFIFFIRFVLRWHAKWFHKIFVLFKLFLYFILSEKNIVIRISGVEHWFLLSLFSALCPGSHHLASLGFIFLPRKVTQMRLSDLQCLILKFYGSVTFLIYWPIVSLIHIQ